MLKAVKIILAILTFFSFVYFFHWKFTLLLMATIMIHEYGHLAAMNFLGVKNRGFIFLPLMGGIIIPGEPIPSLMKRSFIHFAGPGMGLFSAILFLITYGITGLPIFVAMASWSALFNLINMLPIPPFDGGMIFRSILNSFHRHLGKAFTLFCGAALIYITVFWLSMPVYFFVPVIIFSLLDILIEFHLKKRFGLQEDIGLNKPQILITSLAFVVISLSLFSIVRYSNRIPNSHLTEHFSK